MHDPAPAEPPPPPADSYQHHHPHAHDPHPPDEPPPSYDDAIGNSAAPPSYGTFRPYTDESSIASSEVEPTDRALPEWFGQALVVFIFLCIIYGFWEFINAADELPPEPPWPGHASWRPPTT
ncbi:hypothetical protein BDW02DRAFT_593662 [Decorospora gaudefroyi]|uniref:Uncharacterized protein n=1 Tax=Decorospora gaudefroyi TaxID=184978 RepID=A0A6A5KXN0_9PLEO|nr:hypothetical protein BDW02DRAFT_593662 [Decorospora gaudefroyi]